MKDDNNQNIAALILAAGFSSRMGAFKPLLPMGPVTVVERVAAVFRFAGVPDIKVVVGHRAPDMSTVLQPLPVEIVKNNNYTDGMFSSVIAGAKALTPEVEAFFVQPVDIPLVAPLTIKKMLKAYQERKASVYYPCFDGRRGHPPLIAAASIKLILSWNGDGGLKGLLRQWEHEATDVEVDDQGVLTDMDTPEDYRRIEKKYGRSNIPTPRECLFMHQNAGVEDQVTSHCQAVAAVAGNIARALNQAGCRLNIELILAAGLLHDIAKEKPNHAPAGAQYLRELGYPLVADIVECHMDGTPPAEDNITEADIVFLADKLVHKDQVITLEHRFQLARERFASRPDIARGIEKRHHRAQAIKRKVEQIIAFPLESII